MRSLVRSSRAPWVSWTSEQASHLQETQLAIPPRALHSLLKELPPKNAAASRAEHSAAQSGAAAALAPHRQAATKSAQPGGLASDRPRDSSARSVQGAPRD
jgi:hypothetical protein